MSCGLVDMNYYCPTCGYVEGTMHQACERCGSEAIVRAEDLSKYLVAGRADLTVRERLGVDRT